MADDPKTAESTDEGKGAYGTHHVMEEEMRAAQSGIYEPRAGDKRKRGGAKASAPADNKMEPAPANKSAS